jgi:hypothetical protein
MKGRRAVKASQMETIKLPWHALIFLPVFVKVGGISGWTRKFGQGTCGTDNPGMPVEQQRYYVFKRSRYNFTNGGPGMEAILNGTAN